MTEPIGTYTFLPWIRQGIANQIGAVASARRANRRGQPHSGGHEDRRGHR
jgi:hypothetical protein